jgi:hypothetical protein
MISNKQHLGQYYTRVSPFEYPRFRKWVESIPNLSELKALEPFAGSNSIVRMMGEAFPMLRTEQWSAFDIDPEAQESNQVPQLALTQQDTLTDFPGGYDLCVTNPPYLAKNSAARKGAVIDFGQYQDLFEIALNKMLQACPWVAAIIPESFITRDVFRDRLEFVISLTHNMFDDTEFPVCLAVFSPTLRADFEIWRNEEFVGSYNELVLAREALLKPSRRGLFVFNDPHGLLGLFAVDMTKGPSIRFVAGSEIAEGEIKHTSRAITRISLGTSISNWVLKNPDVIESANQVLAKYRMVTRDVFLTSFKGLRDDGEYRRRLDWDTAGRVLATAMIQLDPQMANRLLRDPILPW